MHKGLWGISSSIPPLRGATHAQNNESLLVCRNTTKGNNFVRVLAILLICSSGGCNVSSPASQGEKLPSLTPLGAPDLVSFESPGLDQFEHAFNVECPNNGGYLVCTLSASAASSPIKGINGQSICITPEHEYSLIVSAWFTYEGNIDGFGCQISPHSYDEIKDFYREDAVFKKYMDHKDLSGFETWKIKSGYLTLYRDIRGTPSGDGSYYDYYLYAGPRENPQYSGQL